MAEPEELLQEVLDHPDDDAPRLAYAAWCERNGESARAELIRVQLEYASLGSEPTFESYQLLTREQELIAQGVGVWGDELATRLTDYKFHRGFVEQITLSATTFLADGEALFQRAPIRYAKLTDIGLAREELFRVPLLERLRALSLRENGLTDADMQRLASGEHLFNLWWIDLSYNSIGFNGARTLAASTKLPQVTFLSLKNNPCDPAESFGVEGVIIQDSSLPAEGKALEAEFGHIPWLHVNTDSLLEYPPNPLQVRQ